MGGGDGDTQKLVRGLARPRPPAAPARGGCQLPGLQDRPAGFCRGIMFLF